MRGDTPERFLRLFRMSFDQDKFSVHFEGDRLVAKPNDDMELRSGALIGKLGSISIDMSSMPSIEGTVKEIRHEDLTTIASAANTEYTFGEITYSFPTKQTRVSTLPIELWMNMEGFSIMGQHTNLLHSGSSKDSDSHLELMAKDVDELRLGYASQQDKEKIKELLRKFDFVEHVDEKARLRKPLSFGNIEEVALAISEKIPEETTVRIYAKDLRKSMLQKMSPNYDSNIDTMRLRVFAGDGDTSRSVAYDVSKVLSRSDTYIKMHKPFEETVNPMIRHFGDDLRIS